MASEQEILGARLVNLYSPITLKEVSELSRIVMKDAIKRFIFSGNIKDGSFWDGIEYKNKLNKLINE